MDDTLKKQKSILSGEQDAEVLRQISPPLLAWYRRVRRPLLWREKAEDPSIYAYRVWISEIMLQQTRVETVTPYFTEFIQRLPNVKALADCPEDELLKRWEGLGYYSRVKNLQKAARILCGEEKYQGRLPSSAKELSALPGIGPYTAGAIASIAFGEPVPAVDGNVLRVVSRILALYHACVDEPAVKKEITRLLEQVMPREDPGDFNQALMELGAVVCLPNGQPLCAQCPVLSLCRSAKEGNDAFWRKLPLRKEKTKRRVERRAVLLFLDREREAVVLHKRPQKGLLAGLWEFPSLLLDGGEETVITEQGAVVCSPDWLRDACRRCFSLRVFFGENSFMGKARHIFTHLEWDMEGWLLDVEEAPVQNSFFSESPQEERNHAVKSGAPIALPEGYFWVTWPDLAEKYTIPSAFSAWTSQLKELFSPEIL